MRSGVRYLIGFIIFLGLFISLLLLIFHHPSSKNAPQTINGIVSLPSLAPTYTDVVFTIDGPLVYNANHNEVRISVGQTQNTIEIIQGYEGHVLRSNAYPNNQNAYNEFLHALALVGFTNKKASTLTDIGACASGNRYYYQIINAAGNTLQNLWSSDCNEGTFSGSEGNVANLFQAQIPDYGQEVSDVDIN